MKRSSGRFGYIELVVTSIIWGVTYVLLKYALSYLDPEQIAFSRFLVSSVFFVPLVFVVKEKYSGREVLTLFLLALTGVLLYQLLFIWGESGLTAGNASFIVSLEPIFIAILGVATKKDKLPVRRLFGLVLATIGLIVLLRPTSVNKVEIFSAVLVLLSALSWAIFTVAGKDLLSRHNPLNATGYVSIFGTILLFPFALSGLHGLISIRNPFLILSLLFIGIFATFLGYYLWFDGLKKVDSIKAGTTLYITPFVTVITASYIISEPIEFATLLGGALIIVGLIIGG
ncbi:MAG: EamA family transporter [Thermoplasmatales archaeon]